MRKGKLDNWGTKAGGKGEMKRLLVLGALASALAFPVLAGAGVVTQRHIGDPFVGSALDPEVWLPWGTNQPGLLDFGQSGGVATVNVSAAAQPGFVAGGFTRCLAHGDFDARVDFNLVDWPAENGTSLSLQVAGTPYNVFRVSWQFDPSEAYGVYLPPDGTNTGATGTSGTLRLTRAGEVMTGYYLSGSDWIPIFSGTGPVGDVPLSIAVFNTAGPVTFAGLPVRVDFDNFKLNAEQIVCP
jgi:hypothetical protein